SGLRKEEFSAGAATARLTKLKVAVSANTRITHRINAEKDRVLISNDPQFHLPRSAPLHRNRHLKSRLNETAAAATVCPKLALSLINPAKNWSTANNPGARKAGIRPSVAIASRSWGCTPRLARRGSIGIAKRSAPVP